MIPMTLSLTQKIAVWIIPVLFAITLHEAAHAWMANRCGDTTAKQLGRLSLNPLKHVDLFGTLLVPLMVGLLMQFQFIFGWAKPVPVRWENLRRPRLDTALVTAAGPVANLIMAIMWALCYKIGFYLNPQTSTSALFLLLTAQAGITINLILAVLNLLPIPPLDGSRIVASMLPAKYAEYYMRLEPFGFIILLLLLVTGILGRILEPILNVVSYLLITTFNL
jgi:Zn-dependent protease